MMKKLEFAFLTILILSIDIDIRAQSLNIIAGALKTGNVSSIEKYFDTNMEITFGNQGAAYSKDQAALVLSDFFSAHKPSGFGVAHQGTSPQGSKYLIGNLYTPFGNYRTYIYAKKEDSDLMLEEIRFERE